MTVFVLSFVSFLLAKHDLSHTNSDSRTTARRSNRQDMSMSKQPVDLDISTLLLGVSVMFKHVQLFQAQRLMMHLWVADGQQSHIAPMQPKVKLVGGEGVWMWRGGNSFSPFLFLVCNNVPQKFREQIQIEIMGVTPCSPPRIRSERVHGNRESSIESLHVGASLQGPTRCGGGVMRLKSAAVQRGQMMLAKIDSKIEKRLLAKHACQIQPRALIAPRLPLRTSSNLTPQHLTQL